MHSLNLYSHNAIQHMGFWNESFYNALDQAELVKYIKFKLFFFLLIFQQFSLFLQYQFSWLFWNFL